MSCLKLYVCKSANFKPLNGCEVRGMQSGLLVGEQDQESKKSVCVIMRSRK